MSRDADARDVSLITPDAAMRNTAHFLRLRAWNSPPLWGIVVFYKYIHVCSM